MFKSFYKVQRSAVFSDMGLNPNNSPLPQKRYNDAVAPQGLLSRTSTNVLTTNLLVAFVTLFSLRHTNVSKRNAHPSSIVHASNDSLKFVISFFFLPKRKKNVIFLRAPYKNKLARLNILNLEYTFIISIRTNPVVNITTNMIRPLLNHFSNFNISSTKLKHTKTVVATKFINMTNFRISSFLPTL